MRRDSRCILTTRVAPTLDVPQVNVERARLTLINARLGRVRDKIRAISGTSRAITLYATPKYPATDVARTSAFVCLHDGMSAPTLTAYEATDGIAPVGARPLVKAALAAGACCRSVALAYQRPLVRKASTRVWMLHAAKLNKPLARPACFNTDSCHYRRRRSAYQRRQAPGRARIVGARVVGVLACRGASCPRRHRYMSLTR